MHVRVLIVSIGALEKGPIAPEISPMIIAWYDGNSGTSCTRNATFLSSWYTVKFAPEHGHMSSPRYEVEI